MQNVYFIESGLRFDDKLEYADGMEMETTLCPLNTGLPSQHSMRQRWQRPLKVIAPVQRMTDFEWTVYRDIIIEKDILDRLRASKFSGFKFQPVELFSTTQTPIGRETFEIIVTGWGGMASPESGVHVLKECPYCKRRVYSGFTDPTKLFSRDTWDRSDFFIIWPMPRYTFVTKRVADFMAKSGYSGMRVKPIDKFPKSIAGSYTPGHVDDWFEGRKLATIKKQFESHLSND